MNRLAQEENDYSFIRANTDPGVFKKTLMLDKLLSLFVESIT
ncbi:MAG TPA: hypothetical protein PLN69_09135 [bacterium]|nr:hypothetical protein [bacterium]